MKNYNKLKKIIQEANPEIMELKFGCEIKCKDEKIYKFLRMIGFDIKIGRWIWVEIIRNVKLEDVKILGRPIRLADVLLALDKGANHIIMIRDDGQFYFCSKRQDVRWNLEDDNLDNQSDKTKQFLIDLLVKQ